MASREEPCPAYAPCRTCGAAVLTGVTTGGVQMVLDIHVKTFTVLWLPETPLPTLHESRGYPVHRCDAGVVPDA